MFKYLCSKKGYSLVELGIAVVILGILAAVAVPVFGMGIKAQRQKDCSNQRIVIQTAVEQVMYGMVDNGKKQVTVKDEDGNVIRPALDFNNPKLQADHKAIYPAAPIKDDKGIGVKDNDYVGKPCLVLCKSQDIPGKIAFTIGDIRGGYRDTNIKEYDDGCDNGNYLKKKALEAVPFYTELANGEIPLCPFANFDDADKTNDYYYHILWDAAKDTVVVVCSCPNCNEAD